MHWQSVILARNNNLFKMLLLNLEVAKVMSEKQFTASDFFKR